MYIKEPCQSDGSNDHRRKLLVLSDAMMTCAFVDPGRTSICVVRAPRAARKVAGGSRCVQIEGIAGASGRAGCGAAAAVQARGSFAALDAGHPRPLYPAIRMDACCRSADTLHGRRQ